LIDFSIDFSNRAEGLRMSRMSEFNSKFGGGATIAMPRIRYLSAYAKFPTIVEPRSPICFYINAAAFLIDDAM